MTLDPIFESCFAPLLGLPCWQVKPGYGSCITMEFGEPHLEIREPKVFASDRSPKVREMFARRNVTVRGEWHLWIYCCDWSILNAKQIVGFSDDDASYCAATQFLDGQALTSVTVDSLASTRFSFDLGGLLTTSPYDDSEQWMLYNPDGNVLSLRADGSYSYHPSNTVPNDEVWLPVWTP
ncbi:hypothetical protein OAF98_02965 [Planctomicrobium sp.]|nr:hypothetical protein [Planctomicrobium sp.]MDB4743423.1 hypothetical protein [Planctomicrobium sp.]